MSTVEASASQETVDLTTTETERAAQRERNQAALDLIRSWRADKTGYDEQVWPTVRTLIEENRLTDRSRFSD